jgi:hypothetical protein
MDEVENNFLIFVRGKEIHFPSDLCRHATSFPIRFVTEYRCDPILNKKEPHHSLSENRTWRPSTSAAFDDPAHIRDVLRAHHTSPPRYEHVNHCCCVSFVQSLG